jgi:hypothetical protein
LQTHIKNVIVCVGHSTSPPDIGAPFCMQLFRSALGGPETLAWWVPQA